MKYNFTIIKLKKILFITTFFILIILLFIFSEYNSTSIKNSYNIFINMMFPALFPFIFFTEFISNTQILDILCNKTKKIIYKIFPISNYETSPILIGFLCGFPTGAKIIRNLYDEKKINFNQAETLLSFTNNCNPIFIYTTVGIMIFGNNNIGIILLISHILSSLLIGAIYSRKNIYNIIHEKHEKLNTLEIKTINNNKKISFFENIKSSIINSFFGLVNIFGFMLFFNLISCNIELILNKFINNQNIILIITSIFEVTNGVNSIFKCLNFPLELKIIFSSFLLGFSGICIIFQIFSVIYDKKFSLKKLFYFKLLHGFVSTIIITIILYINKLFSIFSISNTQKVFNNIDNSNFIYTFSNFKNLYIILICLYIIYLLSRHITKKDS